MMSSAGLYMTQADIASQYKDLRCFINNDPVSLVTYGTQELSPSQAEVRLVMCKYGGCLLTNNGKVSDSLKDVCS